jgi:hypothetical protein
MYPGNPDNPFFLDINLRGELSKRQKNDQSRRRHIVPKNESICYNYALLYSRIGGRNLSSVNTLFRIADQVQAFFDLQNS